MKDLCPRPALISPVSNPLRRFNSITRVRDASLKLPLNTELNISIRYNREPTPGDPQPLSKSPLYMKYAVDYRLLPNLRVGLNSYLYRPSEEGFPFQSSLASPVMGVGPELKYDLGRWNFLLKSQLETSNRDQGKEGKAAKLVPGLVCLLVAGFPISFPHKTAFAS